MYCPRCKDEFRPGFTRCGVCNVALVESLDAAAPVREDRPRVPEVPVSTAMAEFCGFLALGDAREARDRLRTERIRCEIVIRDRPDAEGGSGAEEEYWLRVERDRIVHAAKVLGYDAVDASHGHDDDDDGFACGECGHHVRADETFCANCGARFEDA